MDKLSGKRKLFTIISIVILITSVIVTVIVSLRMQEPENQQQTPTQSQDPIPEKPSLTPPRKDTELEKTITEWTAGKPGEYAIMVREINGSKRTASYRSDEPMIAASTYKLFLSYAALKHVEKDIFSLDTEVKPGVNISQCIEDLLSVSTDQCAWEMGNLIGWEQLDRFLYQEGYTGTTLNNYDQYGNFTAEDKYSTAQDEAEIAWRLATGTLLNKKHTDLLLSLMKKQVWRERIPAGVPDGIEVADKPGWIYDIENDTGIVYGKDSTYVLAIMSDGSQKAHLAELSKIIYNYIHATD